MSDRYAVMLALACAALPAAAGAVEGNASSVFEQEARSDPRLPSDERLLHSLRFDLGLPDYVWTGPEFFLAPPPAGRFDRGLVVRMAKVFIDSIPIAEIGGLRIRFKVILR